MFFKCEHSQSTESLPEPGNENLKEVAKHSTLPFSFPFTVYKICYHRDEKVSYYSSVRGSRDIEMVQSMMNCLLWASRDILTFLIKLKHDIRTKL